MLPYYLENRLTDGGDGVSPTRLLLARFLVLISVTVWVDSRAMVHPMTSSGIQPATFRLVFFLFLLLLVGWDWRESTWYCGHYWPIVQAPDDRWWWLWSNWWNENWQGKPKYSEKTCPSAILSTTNPTWPDPGRRGGKPATNRWSYGAASPCSIALQPTRLFYLQIRTRWLIITLMRSMH
jgi:hypothetical protein